MMWTAEAASVPHLRFTTHREEDQFSENYYSQIRLTRGLRLRNMAELICQLQAENLCWKRGRQSP